MATTVNHAAFYQLPQTGGIDPLLALGLPPAAQAPVILVPGHDGEKVFLTPRQNTSSRNMARAMRPSGSERLKIKLPIPRSNRFAGTRHS